MTGPLDALAYLLRSLFTPSPTHLREGYIREGAWPGASRVATVCGAQVHPDRTAVRDRPVHVQLSSQPIQFGLTPPERWVTCPACRASAGWANTPAAGSGIG